MHILGYQRRLYLPCGRVGGPEIGKLRLNVGEYTALRESRFGTTKDSTTQEERVGVLRTLVSVVQAAQRVGAVVMQLMNALAVEGLVEVALGICKLWDRRVLFAVFLRKIHVIMGKIAEVLQ